MNADYSDTVKWDEARKTYVDAYGYSSTQRSRFVTPAKIIAVPSEEGINLSVPVSSKKIEFSSDVVAEKNFDVDGDSFVLGDGTVNGSNVVNGSVIVGGNQTVTGTTTLNSQLTMAGTAPIVMNSNYIRLQGLTDSQSIRYNTSNSNVEINGFTGTRILTGTAGATNAAQFDANGLQSRKWARNSSAFTTATGNIIALPQNIRTLLPLGAMTNAGVSGSAWTSGTIGSGTVLTAPFTGSIRVSARIASFSPNNATSFCFLRIYHPTNDGSSVDYDELSTITGTTADIRVAVMGIFPINQSERVGLVGLNEGATTKNMQVLDYHFEYVT